MRHGRILVIAAMALLVGAQAAGAADGAAVAAPAKPAAAPAVKAAPAAGKGAGAAGKAGAAAGKATGAADKAAGAPAGGGLVAKVNGIGITEQTFLRSWEYFVQRSGIPADHTNKEGGINDLRKEVLGRLIDEELLFQESKRRGTLAEKGPVQAEFDKARSQFPSDEAFRSALAENKLSEQLLRDLLHRNLSIARFVEQKVVPSVAVTDAEVHEFYAGNPDKFQMPEQARARHLLVKVDEKADERQRGEARAKAEALLAKVKAGADFAELAKSSSDCPTAPQGGDLGLFERGQMVPEFDAAVFALSPGEISGVVETKFGYHVIKLEEKKPAGLVPEQEAAAKIKEYLAARKTEAALERLVETLRDGAKIVVLMKF